MSDRWKKRDRVVAPAGTPGKVVAVEGNKVTVSFGMTALNGDALDDAVQDFASDDLRVWPDGLHKGSDWKSNNQMQDRPELVVEGNTDEP